MGKWVHVLHDVDLEKRTATCAHCGSVRLHFKDGRPICGTGNGAKSKAWRADPTNRARVRASEVKYLSNPRNRIGQLWSNTNAASRRQGYAPISLSRDEFISWYLSQEKKCMWCPETHRLSVDHDHTTGDLRGLKCMTCNTLEGYITKRGGLEYLEALYQGYRHQVGQLLKTGT